jgi:CRISPR/Cas system-associated exonuclease Cas4 (RecB family)
MTDIENIKQDLEDSVRDDDINECLDIISLLDKFGITVSLVEITYQNNIDRLAIAISIDEFKSVKRMLAEVLITKEDI